MISLTCNARLRLLRRITAERPLQVSVYTIRLDAYGPVLDRRPSTLHHEQHLRGHDLVLPAMLAGHYQ